jgi:predicted ABC-type ATPase
LVLSGTLAVTEFVNADVIAQGLSAFQPEREAMQAGRIMLRRLDELAAAREDFAFETTLASRTFAPWIRRIRGNGYQCHLAYVWLPDVELAVTRVGMRVKSGGHHVPDDVVRRRYRRGLINFFDLYKPIADRWLLYDNSEPTGARLVASQTVAAGLLVDDQARWAEVTAAYENAKQHPKQDDQ